jgi:hypothetical protein
MSRKVTLFTGQWADLPLKDLLPKVKAFGYEKDNDWRTNPIYHAGT